MRKFILVVFVFSGMSCFAQSREEKPIPYLSEKPVSILDDDIKGWSLSLDGQWISEEKTILPRLISRDKKAYRTRINRLGLDNFKEMLMYPIIYGNDTLLLILKAYENGHYKYEYSKKGWRNEDWIHYFVIKARDLNKLNTLEDSTVHILKIKMLDGGQIKTSTSRAISEIKERLLIRNNYNYSMHIMVQPLAQKERIKFHIYAMHNVFPDVEGVLKNFTVNGRTAYGSELLFDYIHYETSIKNFSKFFSLPGSFDFETD